MQELNPGDVPDQLDHPEQVDLSKASVIVALSDEPDSSVSVQVLFSQNPPDTTLNSTWIAEFILCNWTGIVQATARVKAQMDAEARGEEPVAKPSEGLKLISPNGGVL